MKNKNKREEEQSSAGKYQADKSPHGYILRDSDSMELDETSNNND